jgi:TPR repeat protein
MAPSPNIPRVALACLFAVLACRDRDAAPARRHDEADAVRRGQKMLADADACEATRSAPVCQSACDLGHSNSCAFAGAIARAAGDTARATLLYARACDGGSGLGCAGAGDDRKARFYSRVHCEQLHHAASCLELSHTFRDGRGGPPDEDVAFMFRQMACKLGSQEACKEL